MLTGHFYAQHSVERCLCIFHAFVCMCDNIGDCVSISAYACVTMNVASTYSQQMRSFSRFKPTNKQTHTYVHSRRDGSHCTSNRIELN